MTSDDVSRMEERLKELEGVAFNNHFNIEALLDALISAGVLKDEQFKDAQEALAQRIRDAQTGGQGAV